MNKLRELKELSGLTVSEMGKLLNYASKSKLNEMMRGSRPISPTMSQLIDFLIQGFKHKDKGVSKFSSSDSFHTHNHFPRFHFREKDGQIEILNIDNDLLEEKERIAMMFLFKEQR